MHFLFHILNLFIANQFINLGMVVNFLFSNFACLSDCDITVFLQKNYTNGALYIVGLRLSFMHKNPNRYKSQKIKKIVVGATTIVVDVTDEQLHKIFTVGKTEEQLHNTSYVKVIIGFNGFVNEYGLMVGPTYRQVYSVGEGVNNLMLSITCDEGIKYNLSDMIPPAAYGEFSLFFDPASLRYLLV